VDAYTDAYRYAVYASADERAAAPNVRTLAYA